MSFLWFLIGMVMCIGVIICGSCAASVGKFNKWYEDKNQENKDEVEEEEENNIESH